MYSIKSFFFVLNVKHSKKQRKTPFKTNLTVDSMKNIIMIINWDVQQYIVKTGKWTDCTVCWAKENYGKV